MTRLRTIGARGLGTAPRGAAKTPAQPELLLRGATIVTCDDEDRVLQGDVLVRGERIAQVGKVRPSAGAQVVDAKELIVLPGLVMAHVHLCQVLLRGLADDLPLLSWLRERIWPLEAAHDEHSMGLSAELGLAEMLLGGVTSILDLGSVHHQDAVFEACVKSGMRTFGGKSLMDRGEGVPRRLKESTRASLRDAEELERRWNAHPSGLVRYAWIPRFILSCTEAQIRGALERAEASGALFHTHAAEHAGEKDAVRNLLGADDVDVLRGFGMRGRRCSIAHGVQLTARQIRQLARDEVSVAHCPSANLKLGSGIAQVPKLLAAGVNVGVGADGAPCNNNLDPWRELRLAAQLASITAAPGELTARRALRLLTIDGARLLGREAEQGSVEEGKLADLICVRRTGVHLLPALDPITTLVYAARPTDVTHVFIGGRPVVQGGELQTLDVERLSRTAPEAANRLARRAGVR